MRYTEIKNFENEEWRPIEGFDGRYEVSNYGRVKSLIRMGPDRDDNLGEEYCHLLTPRLINTGYYSVCLCRDKKCKNYTVHRLVAAAFLGKLGKNDVINHLDSNRTNNHVSNLEVTTMKGNTQHALKKGRLGRTFPLKPFAVLKDGQVVAEFTRIIDACAALGLIKQGVCQCLHGKARTHLGYTFKYL